MKIITNETLLARRSKLVRWTSLAGLVVLGAGLVASFNEQYYYGALPALAVGFLLANISAYNANRYVKEPRADQTLAKSLRGFDNNFQLFNFTAPVSHVFLTPSRIYTLTVRRQDGQIRKQGNSWRRNFNIKRVLLLFNEEALGNPSKEAQADSAKLFQRLSDEFGEGEIPPIEPVVVFTNPNVELEVDASAAAPDDVAVVTGKDLKKYLRAQPKGAPIDNDVYKRLARFLKGEGEAGE